jgi:hypothetical protein
MKIWIWAFLAVGLAICPPRLPSAEPSFSIAISSSQTSFSAGSPIVLQVIMTNTSSHGISLVVDPKTHNAEMSDFRVEVTDSRGNTPKIIKYYDSVTGEKAPREAIVNPDDNGLIVGSFFEMMLAPGKAERLRMDISKLADLRVPGQYSVRLKRTDPASGDPVFSNVLKITLVN